MLEDELWSRHSAIDEIASSNTAPQAMVTLDIDRHLSKDRGETG